jgi:signal-transduction protein with cAMP-binding, CBS, and nucleotidyltransferase domain
MMQAINEFKMLQNFKDIQPDYSCIHPTVVENLKYEICKTVHRFGDIEFFKPFNRNFWLEFMDLMERRVYLAGDVIYYESTKANNFYLIKRGAVWCITSSEDTEFFPFMEINSHFGGWEAHNQIIRGWTVIAKEETVVFTMPVGRLEKILRKTPYYDCFWESQRIRYEQKQAADDDCGIRVRKIKKVQGKISDTQKQTISNLIEVINQTRN